MERRAANFNGDPAIFRVGGWPLFCVCHLERTEKVRYLRFFLSGETTKLPVWYHDPRDGQNARPGIHYLFFKCL